MTKNKKKVFVGIINITKSGMGFVANENLPEDILIKPENLGVALNGDEVEISIMPTSGKRAQGKVKRVLSRLRNKFVGILEKEGEKVWLIPDNKNIHIDFEIKNSNYKFKNRDKIKAYVRMCKWTNPAKNPTAEIIEVLGKLEDYKTQTRAILLEKDFCTTFPQKALTEARLIEQNWSEDYIKSHTKDREDFRNIFTFTIDPVDAKDFDDALSVEVLENGNYKIGVHIADVTHFVTPESAIEKEARKRATSVYLVGETIPMLPEELSNNICSLKEGEDRFAFSAIFEMTEDAKVLSTSFAETIIRSDKRFTYKSAQDFLNSAERQERAPKHPLCILQDLARKLRKVRMEDGAMEFDTDEVGFELDENKKPTRIFVKERLETMRLIEEFMLLANRTVATFMAKHSKEPGVANKLFIYRVHNKPDADKMEELRVFLRALGYDMPKSKGKQIRSENIAEMMQKLRGTPEEAVVRSATLRSMAKAVYSYKNIGHFSLGFKHYTHFTSPIRRYPDIMVHRILKSHINGLPISKKELDAYKQMAIHSSRREVEAVAAERESVKYKQIEYMSDKIGQTFNGTVTGVSKNGLFVSEEDTKAEGFVAISSLNGWYELDEKNYSLTNKNSGKRYRVGDNVKIKLIKASLPESKIEWAVI